VKNKMASIGHLSLRVPGTGAADGQRVATRVADSLGERLGALPLEARRVVGDLHLRVEPRDLSDEAVTEAIVSSIERALRRQRRGT
jgi:hypothetical protein